MFEFMRKKGRNTCFTPEEIEAYLLILTKILIRLNALGYYGQTQTLQKLMELMQQNDITEFVKLINSVDMWGGAGAVWEIYIENEVEAREFERDIINLIDLMEKTKVLGSGIKSVKKLFENNLTIKING